MGSFVKRERGALWFGHCPWLWFPCSDALLSAKWGCCSPQGWGMCLLTDCKALDSGRREDCGSTAAELPLPCGSKVELAPWASLGNKRARANKRSVSNLLFWGKRRAAAEVLELLIYRLLWLGLVLFHIIMIFYELVCVRLC